MGISSRRQRRLNRRVISPNENECFASTATASRTNLVIALDRAWRSANVLVRLRRPCLAVFSWPFGLVLSLVRCILVWSLGLARLRSARSFVRICLACPLARSHRPCLSLVPSLVLSVSAHVRLPASLASLRCLIVRPRSSNSFVCSRAPCVPSSFVRLSTVVPQFIRRPTSPPTLLGGMTEFSIAVPTLDLARLRNRLASHFVVLVCFQLCAHVYVFAHQMRDDGVSRRHSLPDGVVIIHHRNTVCTTAYVSAHRLVGMAKFSIVVIVGSSSSSRCARGSLRSPRSALSAAQIIHLTRKN